jgi:hypothetical protein
MGLAIDTVLAFSTQAGAAAYPTALAAATGDSLQIRNYVQGTTAQLEAFVVDGGGTAEFGILSPMLHDDKTGLTWETAETPGAFLMPRPAGVQLTSGDTLTVNGQAAAATTITAGLVNYYQNLPGASARLASWGDISGNIKYIKPVRIGVDAVAVGAWTDTLITKTEDQLHARSDYAVLGYVTSAAVDLIGVKGGETGNLRICGPGPTSSLDISEYFITMSDRHGTPHIPVFNADNRGAFYLSAANSAAIAGNGAYVSLILAELRTPFPR